MKLDNTLLGDTAYVWRAPAVVQSAFYPHTCDCDYSWDHFDEIFCTGNYDHTMGPSVCIIDTLRLEIMFTVRRWVFGVIYHFCCMYVQFYKSDLQNRVKSAECSWKSTILHYILYILYTVVIPHSMEQLQMALSQICFCHLSFKHFIFLYDKSWCSTPGH